MCISVDDGTEAARANVPRRNRVVKSVVSLAIVGVEQVVGNEQGA